MMGGAAVRSDSTFAAAGSEPIRPLSPGGAAELAAAGGDAGVDDDAADAARSSAGVALLVARSTVTLRTGSAGPPATAAGALTAGFGPDNSSGTIKMMSTTKIVAPTRRSLRRRSMKLGQPLFIVCGTRQYIREAQPAAANAALRASPAPAPRYGTIRKSRFDPFGPRRLTLLRMPRQYCRRSRAAR